MPTNAHGRRNLPAIATFVKFLEEIVVVGNQRLRTKCCAWDVAAERFAPGAKILEFRRCPRPADRTEPDAIDIVQRNAEARAELAQLVFVELLLLVRDVLASPASPRP